MLPLLSRGVLSLAYLMGVSGPSLSPPTRVLGVRTGNAFSCAVFDNGTIKCWGENSSGQLGLGDSRPRGINPKEMGAALPAVDLGSKASVLDVQLGYYRSCAVLTDGALKCWGFNGSGALGLGDTRNRGLEPKDMGDSLRAVDLGRGRTARSVALGWDHTCALLDNGSVKCWGANNKGQLGIGVSSNNLGGEPGQMGDSLPAVDLGQGQKAISIAAGSNHTCALLDDYAVKCWGENREGELGQGDLLPRGRSSNEMGDKLKPIPLPGADQVVAVVASGLSNCVLLEDQTVRCWGWGYAGNLGYEDGTNRGDAPGEIETLAPLAIEPGLDVKSLSCGPWYYPSCCAVLSNSAIKCWGSNLDGHLGLEDGLNRGDETGEMGASLPFVDLGKLVQARSVSVGWRHVCALTSENRVKCWGGGDLLGQGSRDNHGALPGTMGENLPYVDLGL